MRTSELASRIRLGGDGGLELKEVHFRDRRVGGLRQADLADDLAAIANSRGGLLVLGVDDEARRVTGIPPDRLDAVESLVQEVCNDSIEPRLDAGICRWEPPSRSPAFRDRFWWSRFRGASTSTGVPEATSDGSAVPSTTSNPRHCSD